MAATKRLGGGGNDVIILGPGQGRGSGQGGDDVVDGNGGPDRLLGGEGQDFPPRLDQVESAEQASSCAGE